MRLKKLLQVEFAMLMTATVAGCSALPGKQEIEAAPINVTASSSAATASCVERSAAARPPKHPIVELAWCIAETDELIDPDHLFNQTLGIQKYTTSDAIPWGIKTGAGADENTQLPVGIFSFIFERRTPKGIEEPGNRYLSIGLDRQGVCVSMANVEATFGKDFWLTAVPIVVPNHSSDGAKPRPSKIEVNPYGIFFKSPRLFMRDASGSVSFIFRNEECLSHINIQRNLDLLSYRKIQGIKK